MFGEDDRKELCTFLQSDMLLSLTSFPSLTTWECTILAHTVMIIPRYLGNCFQPATQCEAQNPGGKEMNTEKSAIKL